MEIDPEDLKDRSRDDDGVEPVEGGGKEGHGAQSVHTDEHFKDEGTKEHELDIEEEFSQPFGLIVMLHSNSASIEEDENDDKPEPGRGLANPSDEESKTFLILPKLRVRTIFGRGSCKGEYIVG